jgi:hypothetical protein
LSTPALLILICPDERSHRAISPVGSATSMKIRTMLNDQMGRNRIGGDRMGGDRMGTSEANGPGSLSPLDTKKARCRVFRAPAKSRHARLGCSLSRRAEAPSDFPDTEQTFAFRHLVCARRMKRRFQEAMGQEQILRSENAQNGRHFSKMSAFLTQKIIYNQCITSKYTF